MTHNNYIYIAVMALVSYAIRILPLTLIRKPIKNRFVQSFLYYVPYVTLAVMTFPAIVQATQSPVAGLWRWRSALQRPGAVQVCSRWLWPAALWSLCWNSSSEKMQLRSEAFALGRSCFSYCTKYAILTANQGGR